MYGYETLMELRKMYREKDKELNDTRKLLKKLKADAKPTEDCDFSWVEETQTETRIQRDCIECIARRIFPDLDVDFWKELY